MIVIQINITFLYYFTEIVFMIDNMGVAHVFPQRYMYQTDSIDVLTSNMAKMSIEIPAPASCVLTRFYVNNGYTATW